MNASAIPIAACFVLWAAVHSILASLRVKRWTERTMGQSVKRWYRIGYNAIGAITFFPLLAMLVVLPDRMLYVIPAQWRWLTLCGQAIALIALLWTLAQTHPMHFVGLSQLLADDPAEEGSLQVRGFYRYVRHPLYLFSLILIWLMPAMTANLATVNVLTALYFAVGSVFEEKRLLVEFGEAYAAYQRRVPRLIPRLKRHTPTCPSQNL